MIWLTVALAQENGVRLCDDYTPYFPAVEVDPLCQNAPEVAITRVNACFTTCTSDQQEFRITVVNRGALPAREVLVRIFRGSEAVWLEPIGRLESLETVEVGPIALTATSFDAGMTAVVEAQEDCLSIGNDILLSTALFDGTWPEPRWDADLDGYRAEECGGDDCDDGDARVHPDAVETEGVDVNCNGRVDEDLRRCSTSPAGMGWFALLGALLVRRQSTRPHR
ncbi:MAG: MopE-related protein [Myxococcota bacterium]